MENKIKEILTSVNGADEKNDIALEKIMQKINNGTANDDFVVKAFSGYNEKRYSKPWIAKIMDGNYDFTNVGYYTGDHGDEGELIIHAPDVNAIYAWGQKDYRGNNTFIHFGRIIDGEMYRCSKNGKLNGKEI